tara:strand:- start:232 stop:363 length:132 start_codon:yes stop_codon:yes gene_type:complete
MPGNYGKGSGMKPKGMAMSAMKKAREKNRQKMGGAKPPMKGMK